MKLEKLSVEEFENVKSVYKRTADGRCRKKQLDEFVNEFISCDEKIVRVDFTGLDYCGSKSAYECLRRKVKDMGAAGIEVMRVKGQVYMIKAGLI